MFIRARQTTSSRALVSHGKLGLLRFARASNGGTVESFSMPLESGVAEIVFKQIEEENKEK